MRTAALLLLVLAPALAGPRGAARDMMHPRSPETPLAVKYTPWYCSQCLAEERIEGPAKKIVMMRMPVEELAKVLDLDRKWLVIETPHFRILSTITKSKIKFKGQAFARFDLERLKTIFPKFKVGREGAFLNAHQRTHLYHIRLDRLYCHFSELTENRKRNLGMDSKYEVYLFDDYAEYHTLTDEFIGRAQKMPGVQHHVKEKPNFNTFMTSEQQVARSKGRGDRLFSNWVMHNVVHNLVDGYHNYYRETWAWLEEGLAHYYERNENEKHNTFCWSEGKPPADFLKPNWQSVVYSIVRRGKDPPLTDWCEKLQPGELTGIENGLSWSIVKWLVETEPVRFTKLLTKLNDYQNKPDSATSIEFAFGVSPSVLHQRWRRYVKEHYATK